MAQIASHLAAEMAISAHQVARLMPQSQNLGRIELLAVVEAAVDAVLATIGQVIAVAEVHAIELAALLESLDSIGIRFCQGDIHALVILVELNEGPGSRGLFGAGDVDGHGNGTPADGGIAVGLWLGFGRSKGSRRCGLWRGTWRRGG